MKKEQFIHINEYGTKRHYSDRNMEILHREDGPAVEYTNGHKSWYIDDKLHREDGPAVEYTNGRKAWFINGKLHREDGPAVEYANGGKEWYLNGKELTEEEFNARMKPVTELTLEVIAHKFNIPVESLKIKK